MNRPTRATATGRAYLDFVLKGGLLLAVFDARRPTADADLLARHLASDQDTIADRVRDIAQVTPAEDDGVTYLVETIRAQTIREDSDYAGVRITMDARLATATVKLKLDVNVGDPVTPDPTVIALPSQRPDSPPVPVLGYPMETVLAEKLSTAISLGEANTRVRDYADLHTLTGKHRFSFATAYAALAATSQHRGVVIRQLSQVVGELAELRQPAYDAFHRRLGPDGEHLPERLTDVVREVCQFADPLAAGDGSETTWNPATRQWQPRP